MSEETPQTEVGDTRGTTEHYNGTVGVSPVAVPASAGTAIDEVFIMNPSTNDDDTVLSVSFDDGVNFIELSRRDGLIWGVKGRKTQIRVKGSVADTDYQILMNRDVW